MSGFIVVNNAGEIALNDKWVPAKKFNSKDRLVDEKGAKVGADYQGRRYRLIEKRERAFTCLERFGRGFLGTLVVVSTLCFALFSKWVRDLFTKSKENIRFGVLEGKTQVKGDNGAQKLPRLIDSFDENNAKMLIESYMAGTLPSSQFIKHAGKHMPVFELVAYPHLIFKLPNTRESAEEMLTYIERCQELVKEHALNHCIIPSAKIISPSAKLISHSGEQYDQVIFVMEKVEGLSHEAAREATEVAYEGFQNAGEQAKWKEFFRQAAEFIALSGYWDTSWANILLMKDGFGFVDFENVRVDAAGTNQRTGLSRLRDLAPAEFFDMIGEIAEKHKITLRTERFASSEMRQKDLEQRSEVRQWHKEHGITQAKKIDLEKTVWESLSRVEKQIIYKFNENVEYRAKWPANKGNLIQQREVFWQPFREESSYQKDRLEFEKALIKLNKRGLVCNWTTEESSGQPYLVGFKIYL